MIKYNEYDSNIEPIAKRYHKLHGLFQLCKTLYYQYTDTSSAHTTIRDELDKWADNLHLLNANFTIEDNPVMEAHLDAAVKAGYFRNAPKAVFQYQLEKINESGVFTNMLAMLSKMNQADYKSTVDKIVSGDEKYIKEFPESLDGFKKRIVTATMESDIDLQFDGTARKRTIFESTASILKSVMKMSCIALKQIVPNNKETEIIKGL